MKGGKGGGTRRRRRPYLLSQLLDENQRANENIRVGHVLSHFLQCLGVAKLLEQVPDAFHTDVVLLLVDARASGGEGGLVLGLQHHVHHLELLSTVGSGHHAKGGGREGEKERGVVRGRARGT